MQLCTVAPYQLITAVYRCHYCYLIATTATTGEAVSDTNAVRLPPAIMLTLDRQAKTSKPPITPQHHVMIEFLGTHEFAWLRADAATPLTSLADNPNPKSMKKKAFDVAMQEAHELLTRPGGLLGETVTPVTAASVQLPAVFDVETALSEAASCSSAAAAAAGSSNTDTESSTEEEEETEDPEVLLRADPLVDAKRKFSALSDSGSSSGATAGGAYSASAAAAPAAAAPPVKKRAPATNSSSSGTGGAAGSSSSGGVKVAKGTKRTLQLLHQPGVKKERALQAVKRYLAKFKGQFGIADVSVPSLFEPQFIESQREHSSSSSAKQQQHRGASSEYPGESSDAPGGPLASPYSADAASDGDTTDEDDGDIGQIDSEGPKSCVVRKAALARQLAVLESSLAAVTQEFQQQAVALGAACAKPLPPDVLYAEALPGTYYKSNGCATVAFI
jgi:hypothetical protein